MTKKTMAVSWMRGGIGAAAVTAAVVTGMTGVAVGTASAHGACHSWAHSTSPFTGGFSALCDQDSDPVTFRVVGLCKSRASYASRWVYGPWTRDVSSVGCSWSELPIPNGFVQLR